MICTGTFYDEWLEEKPWIPIPIFLTMICVMLHLVMLFLIKITEKNVVTRITKKLPEKYHQKEVLDLGTNPLSWVIFGLVISSLVILRKMNR